MQLYLKQNPKRNEKVVDVAHKNAAQPHKEIKQNKPATRTSKNNPHKREINLDFALQKNQR